MVLADGSKVEKTNNTTPSSNTKEGFPYKVKITA